MANNFKLTCAAFNPGLPDYPKHDISLKEPIKDVLISYCRGRIIIYMNNEEIFSSNEVGDDFQIDLEKID